MKNTNFFLGERKFVEWDIHATGVAQTIVVQSAAWRLTFSDGVEESSGVCAVAKNRVSALISPERLGTYSLSVTVVIPPETFIEEIQVRVLKNNAEA